ncbi:hypothetical protein V8C86DRAFT_2474362 [Haematococcus lacustris]
MTLGPQGWCRARQSWPVSLCLAVWQCLAFKTGHQELDAILDLLPPLLLDLQPTWAHSQRTLLANPAPAPAGCNWPAKSSCTLTPGPWGSSGSGCGGGGGFVPPAATGLTRGPVLRGDRFVVAE